MDKLISVSWLIAAVNKLVNSQGPCYLALILKDCLKAVITLLDYPQFYS